MRYIFLLIPIHIALCPIIPLYKDLSIGCLQKNYTSQKFSWGRKRTKKIKKIEVEIFTCSQVLIGL